MERPVKRRGHTSPLAYEYNRHTEYEAVLRLTSALDALVPEEETTHPEQRFFQVIHLITEYAWSQVHYEMRRTIELLDNGRYISASSLFDRCTSLNEIAVRSVTTMYDFLPQRSLLTMRRTLPENATGLDSPGHRNIRRIAKTVWRCFEAAMEREGVTLPLLIAAQEMDTDSYERPEPASMQALASVREAMLRLDSSTLEWKQRHLRLIWSQLGGHPDHRASSAAAGINGPTSLGGRPLSVVETRSELALFPALWKAVDNEYHQST